MTGSESPLHFLSDQFLQTIFADDNLHSQNQYKRNLSHLTTFHKEELDFHFSCKKNGTKRFPQSGFPCCICSHKHNYFFISKSFSSHKILMFRNRINDLFGITEIDRKIIEPINPVQLKIQYNLIFIFLLLFRILRSNDITSIADFQALFLISVEILQRIFHVSLLVPNRGLLMLLLSSNLLNTFFPNKYYKNPYHSCSQYS